MTWNDRVKLIPRAIFSFSWQLKNLKIVTTCSWTVCGGVDCRLLEGEVPSNGRLRSMSFVVIYFNDCFAEDTNINL